MKILNNNKAKKKIEAFVKNIENYDFKKSMENKGKKKKLIADVFDIPVSKVDLEPAYFFKTLDRDKVILSELFKITEKENIKKLDKNK